MNARSSYLRIECQNDFDEKVVEVYKFSNDWKIHIQNGDYKIAHSTLLVNDDFGLCIETWTTGERLEDRCLRVIHEVTRDAIIPSIFGIRTSIHIEDGMLVTFNLLILDASKIWYIVPNKNSECFKLLLGRKGLLKEAFKKLCFIQAFADDYFAISKSEMEDHEVS